MTDSETLDRAATLHPFTPLTAYASGASESTVVETGKGVRITDDTGRTLIDGFAGLYCVNIGYGRTEVADAISKQAHKLAFYHSFAGNTTDELARLSSRLVAMAPGKMSKVFYGLSGSDANETQAKIVWYYNNLLGRKRKKKIISRERAYHGATVMAGSLTGLNVYHDHMDLPVMGVLRTGVPHYYWGAEAGETQEQFSQRRADELEALILENDPDTVGAFIGEPVLGTGGIVPPPLGYWAAIQKVLRKYDILLIVDEVITGFGRVGSMFGSEHYGIEPDLVTIAKGLTSAYLPMSGAIVSEKIYNAMSETKVAGGSFAHGYTYSGHPISAAAANVVLDIVERENLPFQAAATGAYLLDQLHLQFDHLPITAEVRGVGMMAAVEFVADPKTKRRFDPALGVGARVSRAARERGVIARGMPNGDILGFAPPLIMSRADVDEMVEVCGAAARAVVDGLVREGVTVA